ncbi:MAG: hypothetical protein ACR2RV_06625 [Verrucomicrobiales bacterium]
MSQLSHAGSSAKQALATLQAAEGKVVSSNIFGLTGRFGQDQPQEWEILARRGDQFAMFVVDKKSVLSYSLIRPKKPIKLPTKALKIDSTKAFKIANKSAVAASIGFDSLDYLLRPRTDSAAPVWIVNLVNVEGLIVGRVHIAADSGTVMRTNWDRNQLNRPARPVTASSTGGTRGIITDRRDQPLKPPERATVEAPACKPSAQGTALRQGSPALAHRSAMSFARSQSRRLSQKGGLKRPRPSPNRLDFGRDSLLVGQFVGNARLEAEVLPPSVRGWN